MDNFLIIRLSSLGDIIHTLPAFSALRKNFPEANISWVVEAKGGEILDFVPGVDKTITAHTGGWRLNRKPDLLLSSLALKKESASIGKT
jgi:ADP-heptose:LPS heptosyltransferase